MATKCRRAKTDPYRRMKICISGILLLLVLFGGVCGFTVAKLTTSNNTVSVIKTMEVPVYKSSEQDDVFTGFLFEIPLSESLQLYIYEICAEKEVPVSLILAMIEQESGFNPEVISATGDYGLMQINKVNHEWLQEDYRCADMLDPYQNVFCGISIISSYIKKYENLEKALMAYNMGDYGAKKAWENGVKSTPYSTKILDLMGKYEEVLRNADRDGA